MTTVLTIMIIVAGALLSLAILLTEPKSEGFSSALGGTEQRFQGGKKKFGYEGFLFKAIIVCSVIFFGCIIVKLFV